MQAQGDDLVITADRDTMRPEQPSSLHMEPSRLLYDDGPSVGCRAAVTKTQSGRRLADWRLLHWMLDRIEGK